MDAALAAEPDALPERVEQIRRQVELDTRQTRSGWDATFNVSKSVTVAHTAAHRAEIAALREGDVERAARFGQIRTGIETAILDANRSMLEYAETLTSTRTGGGSGTPVQWVPAPGLTVASFFQHTNRNIDPQLHVHNVILNRAFSADGKARALDGRDLLDARYSLSAVADRVLEEALTARGFEFELRPDGLARELTIVPPEVCDLFSSRSRQIGIKLAELQTAAQERVGRELTDLELHYLKQTATLATRQTKHHGDSVETPAEMVDRWEAETISTIGTTLTSVADDIEQHLSTRQTMTSADPDGGEVWWSPSAVIAEAVEACGEASSTWTRHFLTAEIGRRLPSLGGLDAKSTVAVLERLTNHALAGTGVRQVSGHHDLPDPGAANATDTHPHHTSNNVPGEAARSLSGPLAGLDGDPFTRPGARRFATVTTLDAEEALRLAGITRGRQRLDGDAVSGWLQEHCPSIGADQAAAVHGIATSDAALTVLVGPAGTGKSYTAGALAGAWSDLTAGEGKVVGLAVSQIATTVLRDDGIPHARNITQWLTTQDRLAVGSQQPSDREWVLGPADVVMVDEASMVATADLARIRGLVDAAGARMVLTGDPRQLGAIEAGGVMGLLDGHAETYTLTDVRRFSNDWERGASLDLRDANPDAPLEYDRHGRLHTHPSTDDAISAAAREAVADRLEGLSVIVTTDTNEQAAAISTKVRDQLIDLGLVDTTREVLLGRDRCVAGVGDLVTARRNDHALGVTNRVQYQVVAVHDDGSLSVHPLARGASDPTAQEEPPGKHREIRLPARYVAEDVQLGYAATVHAAEGLTVDSGHVVTDGGLDSNALYVALTRGRDRNTAHVAAARDVTVTPYGDGEADEPLPARAVLAGCLERDGTTRAATVEYETDLERLSSLSTLAGRIEAVTRHACRDRMEHHLDDLTAEGILDETTRARLCADQAADHLSRLLRAVEQAGHDPKTTLRDAVTARGLGDADSVAQVLSHRITDGRHVPAPQPTTATTADAAVGGLGRDAGASSGEDDGATPAVAARAGIPAGISLQAAVHLTHLAERVQARQIVLGTRVADKAPTWAIEAFGPVPAPGAAARVVWEARAGVVAGHREATGWTHQTRPIGTMPGISLTERRASFTAAWEALGRPEAGLDETQMTEGRLRVRPAPHNPSWRGHPNTPTTPCAPRNPATTKPARPRPWANAAADRADALGDHDEAARLRAEAETLALEAEQKALTIGTLTEQVARRGQWAANTAVTLDYGARSEVELARRGLDLGHESDRTTTEDWLAIDRAAIAAEDDDRPVSESGLAATDNDDERGGGPADIFLTDVPRVDAERADLEDTEEPQPGHKPMSDTERAAEADAPGEAQLGGEQTPPAPRDDLDDAELEIEHAHDLEAAYDDEAEPEPDDDTDALPGAERGSERTRPAPRDGGEVSAPEQVHEAGAEYHVTVDSAKEAEAEHDADEEFDAEQARPSGSHEPTAKQLQVENEVLEPEAEDDSDGDTDADDGARDGRGVEPAEPATTNEPVEEELLVQPEGEQASLSPAHERVSVNPHGAELQLMMSSGLVTAERIADRESQDAAHIDRTWKRPTPPPIRTRRSVTTARPSTSTPAWTSPSVRARASAATPGGTRVGSMPETTSAGQPGPAQTGGASNPGRAIVSVAPVIHSSQNRVPVAYSQPR